MRIAELPFLHFLVRSADRQKTSLRSPMEVEDTSCAGAFFAPVQRDGTLFATYRFHFSIYLGEGTFVKDTHGGKAIFTGVAVTAQIKRRDHLILLFGIAGPEPWKWFPEYLPPVPKLLEHEEEVFIPMFERVPRRRPMKYGGQFSHRDFGSLFIELQPATPQVLDSILTHSRISLIGCDPHTKYERRRIVPGIK